MKTTEIGGAGFAPTVVVAPDARKVGLEEALSSIREYAFKNSWMTKSALDEIFRLGLDRYGAERGMPGTKP